MILQVHDELLIETHPDEIETVKEILKRQMETAASLDVPLIADMQVGKLVRGKIVMKVIGITGGVGSGKSAVLKLLEEEYHAVVVQLDEVAKALQRKGTPCWKAIVEAFGREILDENEELDRKKLAQIVFQKQ